MRIHTLDAAQFLSHFPEIAKTLAYHRDEFFYISDIPEKGLGQFFTNNYRDPAFLSFYQRYRVGQRIDQFVSKELIASLRLEDLVLTYSQSSLDNHLPFVIHEEMAMFWAKLRLGLAKFKKLKCYERSLTINLKPIGKNIIDIMLYEKEYKGSMDKIIAALEPYLGLDWEICICIKRGAFGDGVSLPSPYFPNFTICNYRKLPHDRIWADTSDKFLFASSIGLNLSDDTIIYYPLTPEVQKRQSKLVEY
jgi:hypothetical protein